MSALVIGAAAFVFFLAFFCAVDWLLQFFFGLPAEYGLAMRYSWGVGCGAIIGAHLAKGMA